MELNQRIIRNAFSLHLNTVAAHDWTMFPPGRVVKQRETRIWFIIKVFSRKLPFLPPTAHESRNASPGSNGAYPTWKCVVLSFNPLRVVFSCPEKKEFLD